MGSSILASLSEAGGDVLLPSASKPLPPRSPSSAKRHLECTLLPYFASYLPVHACPSPSDKSLRIRRSRSRPRPPFISLIPKGATSRGTPSRLGKTCMRQWLRLVLTNQKYLHRPDVLPIPSRPSQNQYLWNDQISEASENRRQPAPGGLLRLDSGSNRHPLLRASALQPAEVYLRMRKRLSGPGVCSSLQLPAMPTRGIGLFLPAHPQPQLSHLLGSPCSSRPLTQEQSNSTRLTLAFLDDSGCRKASAEHMMGVPQ